MIYRDFGEERNMYLKDKCEKEWSLMVSEKYSQTHTKKSPKLKRFNQKSEKKKLGPIKKLQ